MIDHYTMPTFVYFFRPIGLKGPIKIGASTIPQQRLLQYCLWSPFPLEIVLAIPGGLVLEQKIHQALIASHSHQEWFHPTAHVLRLVEGLVAGTPVRDLVDLEADWNVKATFNATNASLSWTPVRRRRHSYMIRLINAGKRISTDTQRFVQPEKAEVITDWWQANNVDPTSVEIEYLEACIREPHRYFRPFETRDSLPAAIAAYFLNAGATAMSDLFEAFTRARSTDPETSHIAALAIMEKVTLLQLEVLRAHNAFPFGLTDWELQNYFKDHGSTYRTRRAELTELGLIEKTDEKRRIAGSLRVVWRIRAVS